MHAGGGADNGGEKSNVLIASGLLPIIIDLALRSETQRGIEVTRKHGQAREWRVCILSLSHRDGCAGDAT